jgi:hypothetical protein
MTSFWQVSFDLMYLFHKSMFLKVYQLYISARFFICTHFLLIFYNMMKFNSGIDNELNQSINWQSNHILNNPYMYH